jgi:hypothetical protein
LDKMLDFIVDTPCLLDVNIAGANMDKKDALTLVSPRWYTGCSDRRFAPHCSQRIELSFCRLLPGRNYYRSPHNESGSTGARSPTT